MNGIVRDCVRRPAHRYAPHDLPGVDVDDGNRGAAVGRGIDQIRVRRGQGRVDKLSPPIRDQQSIGILQFATQLAKRCVAIGRIEDEIPLAGFCDNHGTVSINLDLFGQFDREDGMVGAGRRQRRNNDSSTRVDQNVVRLDANFVKHRAEQRCLVFAISIASAKNVSSAMWPLSTDADLDRYISNVRLQERS